MAKKSTSQHRVRVERIFKIPLGAEEAFTTTGTDRFLEGEVDASGANIGPAPIQDFVAPIVPETLPIPDVFSVVDQRIVRGPGGQATVEIVIDIEDVPGASEYEAFVTLAPN